MKRIDTLEALRGLAAMLVVLYHLQDIAVHRAGIVPFGGLFGAGDRGVDLFFVLSGFIITTTHARDIGVPAKTWGFIFKRACRIFPSVWILTIFAAIIYGFHFGGPEKAVKLQAANVLASLFLLPQTQPALVNVTWTLTYEIFFYSLFALLIANRRLGFGILIGWQVAVALVALGFLATDVWIAAYYLRPICLEFGAGMACALLVLRNPYGMLAKPWVPLVLVCLGAGTFLGGLAFEGLSQQHRLEPVRVLVYGLGPSVLIVGLTVLEQRRAVWMPPVLVRLGGASYAIYLMNFSVITLALAALGPGMLVVPVIVWSSGCIALAVAAGFGFYTLIDKPIQFRLRQLGINLFSLKRIPAAAFVQAPSRSGPATGGPLISE